MAAPTTSTVFGANITAALNNDLALDLGDATASTFHYELFLNTTNATAATFLTDTGSSLGTASTQPWGRTLAQTTSGSYTAGGWALTTPTFVVDTHVSGGRMLWKDGATGTSLTTFTGTPYGGIAYATIAATNYAIVYHYFGSAVGIQVNGGTLTVTWNSTYVAGTLFYIPFA